MNSSGFQPGVQNAECKKVQMVSLIENQTNHAPQNKTRLKH